jgi:hypothetical protein
MRIIATATRFSPDSNVTSLADAIIIDTIAVTN